MKTNLLLLDSYTNIENLISFAFSFSNRSKSKLKIVYIFDFEWMRKSFLMAPTSAVHSNLFAIEKKSRKEFEIAETKIKNLIADYMKKHSVKIPFEFEVSENNRIDLINKELENNPEMLLMISNHQSYSDLTDGVVGHPNLVEAVKCPVLIIPDDVRHAVLKNIMYASDYNPEDITSLQHLYSFLSKTEDSKITVLHNERKYDFDEKLKWLGFQDMVKDAMPEKKVAFKLKTNKDFLKGMDDYIKKNDPDLLVLLKEDKSFFEQAFTSNDTKSVMSHFSKPVLVYHENHA